MTKNKSAKRKRMAQADAALKQQKTSFSKPTTVTILPDGTSLEPKHLDTVIPEEELDIAVDVLMALTQYPSLIKSKRCRDLRTAMYDFRQACAVTSNASEGTNLTGRITSALSDERYTDAKVMLAEMRLRGDEPKLGALCRWVRDLDVISGLSTVPDLGAQEAVKRSERDIKLLRVLDAVLRVTGLVDTNIKAASHVSSPMVLQEIWDLHDASEREQVYASVVDKTILQHFPTSTESSLRIIEETPGLQRKPPNHYPAILYTTTPNAVQLSSISPKITCHNHPHVPNLRLASNVLSPAECKAIIAAGESVEFLPDAPIRGDGDGDISVLAHNFYWIIDTAFHDVLWSRIAPFLPASVDGRQARCLNRRFRVYRYVPGAEYRCHIDGAWPPSGILPDDTYVYDSSPPDKKQSSLFTFLIYLNDEFEGGETTFFLPAAKEGTLNAYPVRPVMGSVAIFPHGETKGALLHEGTGVRKGAKYIIRTDVVYDVNPTET